jgi:hypothetical protein
MDAREEVQAVTALTSELTDSKMGRKHSSSGRSEKRKICQELDFVGLKSHIIRCIHITENSAHVY